MPFIEAKNTRNSIDRFNRAPPGISLASPPGRMPFESPPMYAHPADAVDAIIDNIERPETEEKFLQLMTAGVSVEELVDTLTVSGFVEGMFSPDVAEIIKPPLGFYLMGLAAAADIPVKPFRGKDGLPPEAESMDDVQIFEIMRVRNPELAKFVVERPQIEKRQKEELKQRLAGSFLGAPIPPQEEMGEVLEGEYEEMEAPGRDDYEAEEEMNG